MTLCQNCGGSARADDLSNPVRRFGETIFGPHPVPGRAGMCAEANSSRLRKVGAFREGQPFPRRTRANLATAPANGAGWSCPGLSIRARGPNPLELHPQIQVRAAVLQLPPAQPGVESLETEEEVILQPAVESEIDLARERRPIRPSSSRAQTPAFASQAMNRRPGLNFRSPAPSRPESQVPP